MRHACNQFVDLADEIPAVLGSTSGEAVAHLISNMKHWSRLCMHKALSYSPGYDPFGVSELVRPTQMRFITARRDLVLLLKPLEARLVEGDAYPSDEKRFLQLDKTRFIRSQDVPRKRGLTARKRVAVHKKEPYQRFSIRDHWDVPKDHLKRQTKAMKLAETSYSDLYWKEYPHKTGGVDYLECFVARVGYWISRAMAASNPEWITETDWTSKLAYYEGALAQAFTSETDTKQWLNGIAEAKE